MLSAALITRDSDRTALEEAVQSIRPFVDEIVLLDTGSKELFRPQGIDVFASTSSCNDRHGNMIDFAAARNTSFARASGDFITWMDSDDVLDVQGASENVLRDACRSGARVFYPYDYDIGLTHPQARIVPRGVRWTYPIHELLISESLSDVFRSDVVWRHKRKTKEDLLRAATRNLRIASYWYAQYRKDPRFLYYLGQSHASLASLTRVSEEHEKAREHKGEALAAFTRSFELQPTSEHAFSAAQRLFYLSLPHYDGACRWAWKATACKPSWPQGYYLLGRAFYHLSADRPDQSLEYAKLSVEFFELGMRMPQAKTVLFIHEGEDAFDIHRYYNVVLYKVGRIAEALQSCETGIRVAPYPQLLQNRDLYKQKLGLHGSLSS